MSEAKIGVEQTGSTARVDSRVLGAAKNVAVESRGRFCVSYIKIDVLQERDGPGGSCHPGNVACTTVRSQKLNDWADD